MSTTTCPHPDHASCRLTLADSDRRLAKLEQMLSFERRKNESLRSAHTASQLSGFREQILGENFSRAEAREIKDKLETLGRKVLIIEGTRCKVIKLIPEA